MGNPERNSVTATPVFPFSGEFKPLTSNDIHLIIENNPDKILFIFELDRGNDMPPELPGLRLSDILHPYDALH